MKEHDVYSMLMFVLSLPIVAKPMPVDVTYQQLGPCHWWQAHTEKGEKFLKDMPEKYRAPTIEAKGGAEKITGRSEYNAKTKSIYASPSVLQQLKDLAEKDKLKVEEYDPYEKCSADLSPCYHEPGKPCLCWCDKCVKNREAPEQTEYEKFRAKILEAPVDGVTAGFLTVGPTALYAGSLPHCRVNSGSAGKLADGCYECYREDGKACLRVIQVPKPMPQRKPLFPLLQHLR